MNIIERILAVFGYVKKNKQRLIVATYQFNYWSSENRANVWFKTSNTGLDLFNEVNKRCRESIARMFPEASEETKSEFIILNISVLENA